MSHEDQIDDTSAPLIEHLAELRSRLIRAIIAFVIAMLASFTVWNPIYNWLARPICSQLAERGQDCSLVIIKLQEGFMTAIQISLFGGFVLAFPIIAHQLWRFVAPGLYRSEKNAFLPFIVASPVLFLMGASFAYYVVLPLAFDFFLGFQQGAGVAPVDPAADPVVVGETAPVEAEGISIAFMGSMQEYLGLTIKFLLAFGLCFQLPVLLTLMGKAGLVSAEGLRRTRKYAVIGILVLAAVVTPPDVITQVILFAVVYALYEISIQLVAIVERKREAQLRAEGYYDDEDDETEAEPRPGE
ncbi:twin-arginine translocase subunit TatC [Rhodobacteraceae bacterium 2CG4]|uniref:Sec-independent protein translocase protein TatC n=1 Tax=Halovulum marinum TaxID=2662447 RepID=A0A6L5YYJ7_9RHOB|nr:twin-arginine translocase subunit TatC [Halovulum marinum]MSU88952.1 twin-arginine translocase subunit TatC [Halovulum marinum]